MMLAQNQRLFQNLTIENLDVDTLHSHSLQVCFWQSYQNSWLQGLDLQFSGLFTKQALDTHHDIILRRHVLSEFLVILKIELPD